MDYFHPVIAYSYNGAGQAKLTRSTPFPFPGLREAITQNAVVDSGAQDSSQQKGVNGGPSSDFFSLGEKSGAVVS